MRTIFFIKYYYYLILAYCKYLFQFVIYKFADYPDEIQVAALVSVGCVFVIIIMTLRLFVHSRREKKRSRQRERIEQKYGKGMEYMVSAQASELMTEEEIADVFELDKNSYGSSIPTPPTRNSPSTSTASSPCNLPTIPKCYASATGSTLSAVPTTAAAMPTPP